MLNVVVKRSKWLRGEGSDRSRLLRPSDGKMCCLGFVCLVAGATPDKICDLAEIEQVWPTSDMIKERGIEGKQRWSDAYHLNDSVEYTDSEREEDLIEWGKNNGIAFMFVD